MGTKKLLGFECIVFVGIFAIFIVPAQGIKCHQCTSTNSSDPFQCSEFLTDDIDREPTPCDEIYGAVYCIKHVGRFEDGVGTKRYCSSHDLGNFCEYVSQPGDELEYRTCRYTCSSDGCNPASTSKPNTIATIASILLAIGVILFRS